MRLNFVIAVAVGFVLAMFLAFGGHLPGFRSDTPTGSPPISAQK